MVIPFSIHATKVTVGMHDASHVVSVILLTVVAHVQHNEQRGGLLQASSLVAQVDGRPDLVLKYQACYARIADSKRRFLDAAMKYYELSQTPSAAGCAPFFQTGCAVQHATRRVQ